MGRVRKKRDSRWDCRLEKGTKNFFSLLRIYWQFCKFPQRVCVCVCAVVSLENFTSYCHLMKLNWKRTFLLIFIKSWGSLWVKKKKFLIQLSLHLILLRLIIVIMARWMFKKRFDFLRFLRFVRWGNFFNSFSNFLCCMCLCPQDKLKKILPALVAWFLLWFLTKQVHPKITKRISFVIIFLCRMT